MLMDNMRPDAEALELMSDCSSGDSGYGDASRLLIMVSLGAVAGARIVPQLWKSGADVALRSCTIAYGSIEW